MPKRKSVSPDKILVTVKTASGKIVHWRFKRELFTGWFKRKSKFYVYYLRFDCLHRPNVGLERCDGRDMSFSAVTDIKILSISHPRYFIEILCPD